MSETIIDITDKTHLHDQLSRFFGFDAFRGEQLEIIQSILRGQDTFVIMPTGGGKSLCYQLPALLSEGTALIISPLIALMKNQVDSIRGHNQNDEIAHFLNSSLNKGQMREVKEDIISGKTKMLFVAPETLTKEENIEFFKNANVSFVAVDEAHCISEWGHDFRPEYRRIRHMIDSINKDIPIIALTATATPKVQSDIVKNLEMDPVNIFISSFNRDNLYYEVRPKINKEQTVREIVQFVKTMPGKTGIVYVQARKSTEEIAKILQVNGVKAAAYHAGLDAKTRSKVQDEFLDETLEVIVATIAFGMGIDKPDVRFVIHYDIPKSIENYYQETGRGGRDGLMGKCLTFYSYKDILKQEKFLRDKPVAERELSAQLMEEIIAYAETSSCRRSFLLHYFGEDYGKDTCELCDNCKYPKEKIDVTKEMKLAIQMVDQLSENYTIKMLVDFAMGKSTKDMRNFKFDQMSLYGKGQDKEDVFWHSIFRQGILNNLLYKEIEQYGLIKISDEGRKFVEDDKATISIPINRDFDAIKASDVITSASAQGSALDETLMTLLKDLRKSEAKRHGVKPWVVFGEPSLQDMATYYPVSMQDMQQISGVSAGKAQKYGKPFIEVIKDYVEENDIDRNMEFTVKQVANKSREKVAIIQSIDKKIPLDYIADQNKMTMEDLLYELNAIVDSGTKLNIDYYLNENMDEDIIEEIFDYFNDDAEEDNPDAAFKELQEDDVTLEEVLLVRVKFMTEVAN